MPTIRLRAGLVGFTITLVATALSNQVALAQIPMRVIPYEGFIDLDGVPVNSGGLAFNFALFPCEEPSGDPGCEPIWVASGSWDEGWPVLDPTGTPAPVWLSAFSGRFAVELGADGMAPLPETIFIDYPDLYLAIQLEGIALVDLQHISPTPSSFHTYEAGDLHISRDLQVDRDVNIDGFYYGDGSTLSHIGRILQLQVDVTNAFLSSASAIPWDDTIPQISEGVQVSQVTISPQFANSLIIVDAVVHAVEQSNTSDHITVCIFRDGAADAIACSADEQLGDMNSFGGQTTTTSLRHVFVAGTMDPIDLTLRAGINSGTININGASGSRRLGGTLNSGLYVSEMAQ